MLPRLGNLTILVACTKSHDNKGLACNCTTGINKIENKPEVIFLQYLFKLIQHPATIILKGRFQPWLVNGLLNRGIYLWASKCAAQAALTLQALLYASCELCQRV